MVARVLLCSCLGVLDGCYVVVTLFLGNRYASVFRMVDRVLLGGC